MKKCLLVQFFFPLLLFGQNTSGEPSRTIDSLKVALKNAKHDTIRCNVLLELTNSCYLSEPALAINYCEQAMSFSLKANFNYGISECYGWLGYLYGSRGDIPKSLEYYKKGLQLDVKMNRKTEIAISLNNIGMTYKNQGDIPQALEYYHKSLKINEQIGDKYGIASSLLNIGTIYNMQGDIIKSLEYFHKSLKISEEIKNKQGIAYCLNNMGSTYTNQGKYTEALVLLFRSLKIREEMNNKYGIVESLNNIGLIYFKQNNIKEALHTYQMCLKTGEEINDKRGMTQSLNVIGSILLKQEKPGEALAFTKRSLHLAKELGYPQNISRAASTLKKIYLRQNNFKDAFETYGLEIQMRDSTTNEETKKASVRKQFQYQYEKKAAADSVKNVEEQKVKDAQLTAQSASLKQEKTQRYALYGGLVLVIGFLAFVFNRFRVTQKQKKIIEGQKIIVDKAYEDLHEKNKEVMDSIYYARRIQRALITSEKYIEDRLNRLMKN